MATYSAMIINLAAGAKEDIVMDIPATIPVWTGAVGTTTYYKCRATSDVHPSGYITWENTTGDETGRPNPGGTIGPTQIVGKWQ